MITVVGHDDFVEEITGIAGNTIPVFTSPEEAAAALAGLWKYTKATGQAK